MSRSYLDHAASTPMRPEAVAAMVEVLERTPGNPSGQHHWARAARRLLDDARDQVAEALGGAPGEVVFTSGGTEADNLAITGVVAADGGLPLCSAAEHAAVLDPVRRLGGTVVGVDSAGRLDLDALRQALAADPTITLVSAMAANNEVGTCNPIDAIAQVVRSARPPHASGLVVHTDAVAGAAWLDLREAAAGADLVSVSGHKVGGPKGIGALLVRDGTAMAPQLQGGGQERERRSGTQNVAGAVALGVALGLVAAERPFRVAQAAAQRDRLVAGILAGAPGVRETVPASPSVDRLPNVAHVGVAGVESEALLFLLDQAGVGASAGSSCASGALEPSHVVQAMGVEPEWIGGSLRLSVGWCTTDAEIDLAISVVTDAVRALQASGRERAS